MRIIAGKYKAKRIEGPKTISTRPTLDRVKEPLFNIINFDLEDAVVLDLFAGSGALGLEAISRGAKKVFLCEKNRNAANIVEKNIEKTNFQDQAILIRNDFEKAISFIDS